MTIAICIAMAVAFAVGLATGLIVERDRRGRLPTARVLRQWQDERLDISRAGNRWRS